MEYEETLKKYAETFKELPIMPKMVSYKIIIDLMEDAIISGVPVNPDDIASRVAEIGEPIDLES